LEYKPLDVTFEITRKCPLNCIFCSSYGGKRDKNELNLNDWKRLTIEAINLGTKKILISGGEPFSSPFFKDLCHFISSHPIDLSIYSSGNIYNDNILTSLDINHLQFLTTMKPVKIIFSLLGFSSDIHDDITLVKGSFDNVIKSIHNAIQLGINVELHFVPIKKNFRELPKVVELAEKMNVNKISILRYVAQGRGSNLNLDLSDKELLQLRKIFSDLKKYKNFVRIGSPFNPFLLDKTYVCTAGRTRMTVRYDGLVVPCEAMKFIANKNQDDIDVRNHSLEYIWNESILFKLARKMNDLTTSSECLSCKYIDICKGGCPAQKMLQGRIKNYDPYCILKLEEKIDKKLLIIKEKGIIVDD